ncbi:MAG: uroporphyrinogen decarboxylase family protein, partial [Thermoguttaceae bacterium]
MQPKECLLAALRLQTPKRIPTFEWFIDTTITKSLCQTSNPIEAVEMLDIDAINIRVDYTKKWRDETSYIDEWGIEKKLTGDILPASMNHPISAIANQKEFVFPDPKSSDRFKTLENAQKVFGDRRAIVLNLRDGFSDMRDLLGYENALMDMITQKQHYNDLLKRVIDYNLALAETAVRRYGIQVVATTDDICSARGPLFSAKTYREMLYPHFYEVIQGFRSLGLLVIKHCDGDVRSFIDL